MNRTVGLCVISISVDITLSIRLTIDLLGTDMPTEIFPGAFDSDFFVGLSIGKKRTFKTFLNYQAGRSGFVSGRIVIAIFLALLSLFNKSFAKRYDYVIELHEAGVRDGPFVGKAVLTKKEKGQPEEGFSLNVEALYINATFFENGSGIQTPMVKEDFYQHSIFDHIWKVRSSGQRRTVKINQGYRHEKKPFKKMVDNESTTACCFIKKHCGLCPEQIDLPREWMDFMVEDYHRGGSGKKASAELKWEINNTDKLDEPESASPEPSCFDIILMQNLTTARGKRQNTGRRFMRSPVPHNIHFLTPTSYFRPDLLEGASAAPLHLENYIFPFDWKSINPDYRPVTDVNLEMSEDAINLYEYIDGVYKEKDEPDLLKRFFFNTTRGSMDLIVWVQPSDNLPWAWEIREKRLPSRAIRFLRIFVPDKQQELQSVTARRPVREGGRGWGRRGMVGGSSYKKREILSPIAEVQEDLTVFSLPVKEVRQYPVIILASLFTVLSHSGCFSGACRGTARGLPSLFMH